MASARRRILYVDAWPQTLRTRLLGLARWEGARFRSVSAYFRLSLGTVFDVHVISPADFLRDPARAQRYDGIVVPKGIFSRKARASPERLALFAGLRIPKMLLDASETPQRMASDATLDVFDVVFKREPYRDRDRYALSARNKDKIHTTMLPCLSLRPWRFRNLAKIDTADYGERAPSAAPTADVFFLGGATSQVRLDIVRKLKAESFIFRGGLHPDVPGVQVEPAIAAPRVFQGAFARQARDARINLALAGRGPFTFRHLDFWCLSCFMLSSPDIAEQETPLPYVDGQHYVSFDSPDDLVDKCIYYLAHDRERIAIAEAGRRLFEEHYSFKRHGEAIAAVVDRIGA